MNMFIIREVLFAHLLRGDSIIKLTSAYAHMLPASIQTICVSALRQIAPVLIRATSMQNSFMPTQMHPTGSAMMHAPGGRLMVDLTSRNGSIAQSMFTAVLNVALFAEELQVIELALSVALQLIGK
jgi:hypothetical protein